jgi:hypothetical protein
MEVNGQLHAPATLPPGKEPRYPLDRRLGGPQSRSGRSGEEKNSQTDISAGCKTLDSQSNSLTTLLLDEKIWTTIKETFRVIQF